MNAPFVRSPYNYDTDAASNESALMCLDQSLTQQSFKEESDINTIVERFGLTGQLPDNVLPPQYGDFTGVVDYHSAMNAVAQAGEAFDALPAVMRARFGNDPANLIAFLEDPSNQAEAVSLGLVNAPSAPSLPVSVPSGTDAGPAS